MPTFTQTRHPGGGLSWGETPTEMENMQLELLKKEIANMDSQNSGNAEVSKEATQMSKKYLDQWNKGLETAGGLYNTAISEISKAQGMVSGAYDDVTSSLGAMGDEMKTEWDTMKTQFGDTKSQLLDSAKEDIGNRSQLTRQFMDLAKSDEAGASGRAMADVAGASEAGRQSEAMRMSGLGIDPTSGRSRSMMTTSRNQEALDKAMAGNKARLGEKDRVAGITATGLNLIDPNKSVNTASTIQDLENNMLSARSNLALNRANIQGNLAGTNANLATQTGNIASGYSQNVVAPQGEMGAAQLGVSQATRPASTTKTGGGGMAPNTFQAAKDRALAQRAKYYGT